MELVVTIALIALVAWGMVINNRLIADSNRIQAAWSDIDVQLKRRHDLIPQLEKAVDTCAAYERKTLEEIVSLRQQSTMADRVSQVGDIELDLGAKVNQVMAVIEAYPDLKSDESFTSLQRNLTDVEDQIQYGRRHYNGMVRIFNARLGVFPDSLIARTFRYTPAEYFQIEQDEPQEAAGIL